MSRRMLSLDVTSYPAVAELAKPLSGANGYLLPGAMS
jgi:hypothetical protein